MYDVEKLNRDFGSDNVKFYSGAGDFVFVDIESPFSCATISLYGAHLTSFQPHGERPVIWLSEKAIFEQGRAIRGGVPICWPWFGAHPTNSTLPKHGFARYHYWQVESVDLGDFGTRLTLFLTDNKETRLLWNHEFKVRLSITINESLKMKLEYTNETQEEVTIGGAFHPYFQVGDVTKTTVQGLRNTPYIDLLGGDERIVESSDIVVDGPIDRVYLDTTSDCIIDDVINSRCVNIAKSGSKLTVVWNPWIQGASGMIDMADDGYKTMLCVEPANMLDDVSELAPGETYSLTAEFTSASKK